MDIEDAGVDSAVGFAKETESYNVFDMTANYLTKNVQNTMDFVKYKETLDKQVENAVHFINKYTIDQANSQLWHSMRQGRITASKLYEASRCNKDGLLVKQILGDYEVPETEAMKRGKNLEAPVLKEAEKALGQAIERSGFILINGLVGATPDGIGDDFIVEIICPTSEKTMKNYVHDGIVAIKVKAQMQAQMMAAKKKRGVLCVADPKFEQNETIYLHWIDFDEPFTNNIIDKALNFWEKYVFKKILVRASMLRRI